MENSAEILVALADIRNAIDNVGLAVLLIGAAMLISLVALLNKK